jgi:hypothetical protein
MNMRSLPEKISNFLMRCPGRMYCDTCIQERLGLRWRQQVQLVTATLAVTNGYAREFNRCCVCQMERQVTLAVADDGRSGPATKADRPVLFAASPGQLAVPRGRMGSHLKGA